MNETINCIMTRRSIRKYQPRQITDDELNVILQAGLYAPNAGSRQSAVIIACQKKTINIELGKINHAAFHGRMSTATAYISKEQPSIADDATIKDGFYGAPTVLTLFAPKDFLYSTADCCVAAESIMLAAHSLGIGSCMVMRAKDTFSSALGQKLQKEWGIDESYEAKVHIALGYPAGEVTYVKARKENRIKVVR
ncbi:MAG: nitroreductase family protein [Treponema sp.]|jgi:nitroreductase|nr:nitroreductase family protein [Treponema sp.]